MKTLLGIVLYMAIGGALFGPALMKYDRECNPLSAEAASLLVATWPAWLVTVAMEPSAPRKPSACQKAAKKPA